MTMYAVSQCAQCGASHQYSLALLPGLPCRAKQFPALLPAPQPVVRNESISAQPLPPIMPG